MPYPTIKILSDQNIQKIHEASLKILKDVGVVFPHKEILDKLALNGANVDFDKKLVKFDEKLVMWALDVVEKKYVIQGIDPKKTARFGYGDLNLTSSPGQYAWFDHITGERRDPVLADVISASKIAEALPNVSIVGAMAVPVDVPQPIRDIITTAEMVKYTGKPTRCWPVSRKSIRYVLEIYSALAGGNEALRKEPMLETFLEPISPLQFTELGLDIMLEILEYGQTVAVGPMVMVSGTGPATLAGTLALENAEILAGIIAIQAMKPGTPVTYGGIPHILDPRTSICSFGSPEQGLMAGAIAQVGKSYDLPVYVNINLTDSKMLDVQTGFEKMGSLLIGSLSGIDLIGHGGIVGTDHGGSLIWLTVDNEAINYIKRVQRGFEIDDEKIANAIISEIGPGGNFMGHDHTVRHYREELWITNDRWIRNNYDSWFSSGGKNMHERAVEFVHEILKQTPENRIPTPLMNEIGQIVESAKKELVT